MPQRIGVISSTQAAGYADFINILGERWGGVEIIVANTQVQGSSAPGQIIRALEHLNQLADPLEVIVIIRGGGSADDLAVFNDEPLVRAVAASRAAVLSGIGHETDTSLVDLVADVSAVTPSNAAQILVPDRRDIIRNLRLDVSRMLLMMRRSVTNKRASLNTDLVQILDKVAREKDNLSQRHNYLRSVLYQLDPAIVLRRGYSIVRDHRGKTIGIKPPRSGEHIKIETNYHIIEAGVINVDQKNRPKTTA